MHVQLNLHPLHHCILTASSLLNFTTFGDSISFIMTPFLPAGEVSKKGDCTIKRRFQKCSGHSSPNWAKIWSNIEVNDITVFKLIVRYVKCRPWHLDVSNSAQFALEWPGLSWNFWLKIQSPFSGTSLWIDPTHTIHCQTVLTPNSRTLLYT